MKNLLILLLSSMYLSACGTTFDIVTKRDDVNNRTTVRMENNILNVDNDPTVMRCSLDGLCVHTADSTEFFLSGAMWSKDWHNLLSNETLILLIDGQRVVLSDEMPDKKVGERGVSEEVKFKVEPALVTRIVEAKEVRYKFQGERGSVAGVLTVKNQENFGEFLKAIRSN